MGFAFVDFRSSVESASPAFSSAHYCLTQIVLVTCSGPSILVVIQHVASLSSSDTRRSS